MTEVDLYEAWDCPTAILAIAKDGTLTAVFPCLGRSTWVPGVARIEVR